MGPPIEGFENQDLLESSMTGLLSKADIDSATIMPESSLEPVEPKKSSRMRHQETV